MLGWQSSLWTTLYSWASDKMRACGDAGLQFRVSIGLGFRFGDKVRVSVRDTNGVRVRDGVRVSPFYFCHTSSPQKPASQQARILPITVQLSAL